MDPVIVALGHVAAAATDPLIDLACLELPEPANLVGGHTFIGDPRIDRVFCDPQVGSNVIGGQPRFGQGGTSSQALDDLGYRN